MSHHWDEFSKSLAERTVPRRQSLRLLGAALAGGILGSLGVPTARAKGLDPCKAFCRCRNKSEQNACLAVCNACNKDPSRLGGSCGNYFCCDAGQSPCGNYCADLASDRDNCGACGNVCWPGPFEDSACFDGECVYACEEGAIRCDGTCTFLDADRDNCGACGNRCTEPGPDEYGWCEAGRCEYACIEGAVYCDGICTFLGNDPDNCGACGRVCGESTPYCSNGQCLDANCGGADLNWDNSNCGFCGNVCPPQLTCVWGVCEGF